MTHKRTQPVHFFNGAQRRAKTAGADAPAVFDLLGIWRGTPLGGGKEESWRPHRSDTSDWRETRRQVLSAQPSLSKASGDQAHIAHAVDAERTSLADGG